jgi:hypothetical protein
LIAFYFFWQRTIDLLCGGLGGVHGGYGGEVPRTRTSAVMARKDILENLMTEIMPTGKQKIKHKDD